MLYETCDEDTQQTAKGMRVKLTFTFSGAGQIFTPYVTVTGLTEMELPKDECPSGSEDMPDESSSVGLNDGDMLQLKAIVKNMIMQQCLQYKNMKCKQSAKRS
eukprot:2120003-Ditylum_brightwellii.AAC.1